MTEDTAIFLKQTLSIQKYHCETKPKDKEQKAYYDGMKMIMEIIATDGFIKKTTIEEFLDSFREV